MTLVIFTAWWETTRRKTPYTSHNKLHITLICLYYTTSYMFILYYIIYVHITLHHICSYYTTSYMFILHYIIYVHITLHHICSYYTTSYMFILHYIIYVHITLHHICSYYTTSYMFILHYITCYNKLHVTHVQQLIIQHDYQIT